MSAELLKKYEPTPTGLALDHERQLWQARFSPCGRFIVAPGYDAAVHRWDISNASGEKPVRLDPLTGHNGWVQCLDFLPSGERVMTADSWGRLTCWPYAEPKPQPLWSLPEAHDGWIRALAVSPDGSTVASGGNDCVVRLWSAADGKLQRELPHPDRIFSLCFHPDGTLASGDLRAKLRQWDVASAKVLRELDAGMLYQHHRIQECGGARHLAFDAAGKRLAVAGQKSPEGGFATGTPCVLVFDWQTGKVIREMPVGGAQDGFAYDARFHPDGFLMGTSCAFPGKGHVWFWKPEDEKAFYLSNKMPNGRSLSLHPDGRRLAYMTSLSANGNGRQLKDGQYVGGTSKIHILTLGKPAANA